MPEISIPSYNEPVISIRDTYQTISRSPWKKSKKYFISLFPIVTWIHRYNLTWLTSDLIAGITVGIVVVPQGMSYAQIATLPVEYGLYSSFVGVLVYFFFATSKDVSIGPVAVMSLQVSKVITVVVSKYPQYANNGPLIASTLALLCGSITFGIGILRLGFILEFIPTPSVLGFMTGSAFTIAAGQIPSLLGLSELFNTREETYLVIINTLKNIKHCNLDAAFGLVALFLLYFFKWFFEWLSRRHPRYQKICFFGSVLRNAAIIIFATIFSYLVCRQEKYQKNKNYPITILKTVPSGLSDVGLHSVDNTMISAIAPQLPISTVILLMEHIAIAKSFGRVNDYQINVNQEAIAIGVTNLIGHFFLAYPATGSFSRSALKSKCGVRTPLAGVFTGIVVLIAIYGLTRAFYYIPNASLSAVIIHAVGDLIAHPRTSQRFWKASPIELVIFIGAVFFSIFISIEAGVYFSVASSLALLLIKIAFPTGQFLGRVELVQVTNPVIRNNHQGPQNIKLNRFEEEARGKGEEGKNSHNRSFTTPTQGIKKYKWIPLDHKNINTDVYIHPPPPGVFVFRPTESFSYPNCSRQVEICVKYIRSKTRQGGDQLKKKLGDRAWNDQGPRHIDVDAQAADTRPLLRALIFDFSATPHIDLSGVQALVDIRQELNKYADREVEYHFASILSSWTRRTLIAEGFGGGDGVQPNTRFIDIAPRHHNNSNSNNKFKDEEETVVSTISIIGDYVPVVSTDTPFFHVDIPEFDEI